MKISLSHPLLLAAATVQSHSVIPHPLALASSFTRIHHELDKINLGNCSLANLSMPLNATTTHLPVPSTNLTLKYIALGRGTQNYTCPSNSPNSKHTTIEPEATGAAATLFDASCIAASSLALLHEVPEIISKAPLGSLAFITALLAQGTRSNSIIIGEHHFNAAGDPIFDFTLSGADSWIAASKIAAAPAPKATSGSAGDVPWLKLGYKKGSGIQEVYRVVTSQGNPPSTCAGQNATIQVEYAAEYWFYGR
ncbi:malate dehydrogenase [Penicillium bovifimosum]|uniref:Malate dehydrogenase n=1 Tax=Penicillium bovifimosum TaxID=126998 RepID=A0A9W9GTL6_9EURO|nr:malate dehydrogenase [Penicillium bovifimosum]KAJ5129792.1 malate dehydrogenase [Penicillium bovifimosum]